MVTMPNSKSPVKTVIQYLNFLSKNAWLPASKEGPKLGKPSKSELKRWCQKGCVFINGRVAQAEELIEGDVKSLVFFPKNSRMRTTMLWPEGEASVEQR